MKNNILTSILLVLFLGNVHAPISAQDRKERKSERKLKKGDKKYENLKYIDARDVYLRVAERGYESEELFTKLGNSYYFNAEYDQAVKWYEKLFDMAPKKIDPLLYLRYSQSLRSNGQKSKAEDYFDRFQSATGRNTEQISAMDYGEMIERNSGRYDMDTISELYDDEQISYGQTVHEDKLIYSSTEEKANSFLNIKDGWSGLSFTSLYEVDIDSANHVLGKPKKLKGKLKRRFHDGSPVLTKDGETMYFTRSNFTGGDRGNRNDSNLKIYRSDRVDGKWQKAEGVPFNGDEFSTAHPALNFDETKLYFVSDREGGEGQSDLYAVTLEEDGSYGHPENLGPRINTPGRETFPFVSKENILYFSSDGHYGLGGVDVFAVKIEEDGSHGEIINVGEPVNSYADDFAFGIDDDTRYGFVSSNRAPKGDTLVHANIYSFRENEPLNFMALIEGYVTDEDTDEPIEKAGVTLAVLQSDEDYKHTFTDEKGYYSVETALNDEYTVRGEKEDYDPDEKVSEVGEEKQRIDLELKRSRVPLEAGMDLAEVLNIPLIYFDFDKWDIREDAQVDIEKIYEVMQDYPDIRIKIHAHTDSRGNHEYNDLLSERRAQSTMDYLIDRGVDENRLEFEGHGERDLVNDCDGSIPCSAEEHQENRRSEFIVEE